MSARDLLEMKATAAKYSQLVDDDDDDEEEEENAVVVVVGEPSISSHEERQQHAKQQVDWATTTRKLSGDDDELFEEARETLSLSSLHPESSSSNLLRQGRSLSGTSKTAEMLEQNIGVNSRRLSHRSGSISSASFYSDSSAVDQVREEETTSSTATTASAVRRNTTETTTATNNSLRMESCADSALELEGGLTGGRAHGFRVSWRQLSHAYSPSWLAGRLAGQRPNKVLRSISGDIRSGELVAVIGPSGCGKTTLLHFLAGNNGQERDRLRVTGLEAARVTFIGQHDCLLPGLTAHETLLYASRLQNARGSEADHALRVEQVLADLGLVECAHRPVTKLSGGQMKRVTIGQEMLYPSNLMIMDEVTSGLDASTSLSIVSLLKRLMLASCEPMAIVMSIHQPSAKLFAVFDRCYAMSEGAPFYEGSTQVHLVNQQLAQFGLECPKYHNIADHLIELATDEASAPTRRSMAQLHRKRRLSGLAAFASAAGQLANEAAAAKLSPSPTPLTKGLSCQNNSINISLQELDREQSQPLWSQPEENAHNSRSLYEAIELARSTRHRPILGQFVVHFRRSLLRISRSHILTYLQLVTYIVLGLQLSTFYGSDIGQLSGCPRRPMSLMEFALANDTNDLETNEEMHRIQENVNFLLVAVMTATFAAMEITVITFPMEAKSIRREWRNGWYRVSSYFLGRTLADLPFQMIFVTIFAGLIYSITGQVGLTSWRFLVFLATIWGVALFAQSVGFIFGAIFMNNLPAAVFTAPLVIFPNLLFSGFFSRISKVPSIYQPLTQLSHFRFAFDALILAIYGHDRCQCDQATLDYYHRSMSNQTVQMMQAFSSLFTPTEPSRLEPSTESSLIMENIVDNFEDREKPLDGLNSTSSPSSLLTSTASSVASLLAERRAEQSLIDTVFHHISTPTKDTNATSLSSAEEPTAVDHLNNKFATRLSSMLGQRANFGHKMPYHCKDYKSYLVGELGMEDSDLIKGLAVLFLFVILSRILCNIILNRTIASRATS